MSQSAKTLLYWVSNAKNHWAECDGDEAYCLGCASFWARYIITEATRSNHEHA